MRCADAAWGKRGLSPPSPQNFPYFHVSWKGGGYAHIIEDEAEWQPSFGASPRHTTPHAAQPPVTHPAHTTAAAAITAAAVRRDNAVVLPRAPLVVGTMVAHPSTLSVTCPPPLLTLNRAPGMEVCTGMMDMTSGRFGRQGRGGRRANFEAEKREVLKFLKAWEPFDWTQQLEGGQY